MENFVEKVKLEILDPNYLDERWIEQDPTRFVGVMDLFEYGMRIKRLGYSIRFSYSYEKDKTTNE